VPLVIAAAVSHVYLSGIDCSVLLPLIIGATPGIVIVCRDSFLRRYRRVRTWSEITTPQGGE
jgi:hypothetical protein